QRLAGGEEVVVAAREVGPEEEALARRVLRAQPAFQQRELPYGRVDMAPDELGILRVIELELVEPSLFLVQHEPALERFVAALKRDTQR
ncbi:MAG: hypothetical protein H7287_11495, partial [Thermoleophilia bacterium]|nr:hypothetical protein [Thermoleophilia bacterium]